jgi:hypothetical protein
MYLIAEIHKNYENHEKQYIAEDYSCVGSFWGLQCERSGTYGTSLETPAGFVDS